MSIEQVDDAAWRAQPEAAAADARRQHTSRGGPRCATDRAAWRRRMRVVAGGAGASDWDGGSRVERGEGAL
eukprot:355690-Chlamydomonas_euryale.AAC.9